MTARHPRWKQQLFLLMALLLVLAPAPPKSAIAQTADEVVLAVEKHYEALADLTAKVSQINHFKAVGKTQTFAGALLIKRPGKLRLEFTNGQMILIDGKAALFYSKKSEEVIKKTFTDFGHMNIPVAFLLGAGHIRDDFDVRQPDAKSPLKIELLPRKTGAAMKKLELESNAAGGIDRLTIFDRSGNVTEIVFSDARENTGLDDKLFSFKPPKGTEIIEQ